MKTKVINFVRGLRNGTLPRFQSYFKSITLLLGLVLSVNAWGEIATGTYVLCTSTSDLKAGDHYIIASGTSSSVKCISNESNNNNRKEVAATVTDSKITVDKNSTIMTLTLDGSTGSWTFHTDNYDGTNGYLASAASGNNNYCRVISDATTATISFSENAAVITLNPHTSRNILRYNSSASCFACYSSGQAAVYLYHKSSAPAHTITAQSNNNTFGTVSLSGQKITASPNTGYTYASPAYTVTNGTATVVQDGNEFTVTPESDCTVRINFAAKQIATITLMEAGTPVAGPSGKYSGETYTLPSSVTNVCDGKTFVGWSTVEIQTPGAKPTSNYYEPGDEVTLAANNNFYAVFADKEGEGENGWVKITKAEDIVAGVYAVISYDEAYYLPTTASSSSNPTATAVTKTDDKIDILDAMKWDLTISEGVINLESATTAGVYAWGGSANDGVRVNSTSAKANATKDWRVKTTTNYGLVLYNNATTADRYLSTYGTTDWRNYTSTNSTNRAANLYKLENNTSYSAFVTSCKACESEVAVTKAACENGSFTVSKETVCADDGGGSVTVTCTPNEHYHVSAVTATVGSVTGSGNSYTVSGITAATEIAVTFAIDQQITVTWNVNGTETPQLLWPGEHVTALPEAPTVMPICANTFMGWSTSTLVGEGHDAPTDLFNKIEDLPEITGDVTFNAVFAQGEGSEAGTLSLTTAEIKALPFANTDPWNTYGDQTYTNTNTGVTWTFNGTMHTQQSNVSNDYIQVNQKVGLVHIPEVSGNITKIEVVAYAGSNGRYMQIMSGETKIGTAQEITTKTTYTFNIEGAYTQLNIANHDGNGGYSDANNAINIYSITVSYGGATYSNYVTSCATYTVTWISNGYQVREDTEVAPGTVLTAPTVSEVRGISAKAACNDYLVGWMPAESTTNPKYTSPDTAPTGMIGQQVTVTDNVVYHAVYADVVQQ